MTAPLILVDGSSYFFRAFHALPSLTNSKGQPTGAIYGMINMVKRLIKDYQPTRMAIIFDAKGKTFRHTWYPDYKAHRSPMPCELSAQFTPLVDLLRAMGLPILIVDGVEADDVIGTLAKIAVSNTESVVISTGDKDMVQLINEHVTLINTMTNQILDITSAKEKYGVNPAQFIDYLALVGDPVDNIPGVTKCGQKTAVKWLTDYQTLDNLLANSNDIGGKIGENLRASISHLPLSKQLVTIKLDVELPVTLNDLTIQDTKHDILIALIQELEFKTWLKDLLEQEHKQQAQKTKDLSTLPSSEVALEQQNSFTIITSQKQLADWLEQLTACEQFCITIETTKLDIMQTEIAGIALAITADHPAYIPFIHTNGSPQLSRDEVLNLLKPLLESNVIKKIGQNLKYDYHVFKNHGITLQGIASDIMLESYVLHSNTRHDRDSLALNYLKNDKTITYESIAGKGVKQLSFQQISVKNAAPYATEQANITLKLHNAMYPKLDSQLKAVLQDIEIPLVTVLADMERCGVLIDTKILASHGQRLKTKLRDLEEKAIRLAGKPFNLNSPKQLQEILFDEKKLPILTKTPTGQPSTAESVLQELAFDYQLPAIILEYRSLSKLVSTYIDALPKWLNASSLRVHTTYNQAVTVTGRLSSSEPNLQNIPIRTEEGRLIRTAFVAPSEHVLLAADYSQIELRIMAHLSADKNLLKAFTNGWDIHAATASDIFQVDLDKVTNEQRRRAKAVNFGLIYGMSMFGLAKQLGITRQDAQHYMNCYFARYPGVLNYMEHTREQARRQGYVETLFGRRLYLPEINSKNIIRQRAAERTAINAPMQGTAADIIKKAMLAIAKWQALQPEPYARMIMQVHDELVFEVRQERVEEARIPIRQLMENATQLSVPLLVSIGIGTNWDEAH